jgi:hypothetical protein
MVEVVPSAVPLGTRCPLTVVVLAALRARLMAVAFLTVRVRPGAPGSCSRTRDGFPLNVTIFNQFQSPGLIGNLYNRCLVGRTRCCSKLTVCFIVNGFGILGQDDKTNEIMIEVKGTVDIPDSD